MVVAGEVAGKAIHLFREAGIEHQPFVVGVVIGNPHGGTAFEALHQHADGVGPQQAARPQHILTAAGA